MKKAKLTLATTLSILLAITFLSGCSPDNTNGKRPKPEDMAQGLINGLEFSELVKLEDDVVSKQYTFDKDLVEDYAIYVCSSGALADEIAIFQAKKAGDASKLMEAVNTRKQDLYDNFVDYVPEEVPKINGALIERNGPYVYMVIHNDVAKAKEIIQGFFQ